MGISAAIVGDLGGLPAEDPISDEELDVLIAPVPLYPDALLAQAAGSGFRARAVTNFRNVSSNHGLRAHSFPIIREIPDGREKSRNPVS
jgi:hypothetical protein